MGWLIVVNESMSGVQGDVISSDYQILDVTPSLAL